MDLISEPIVWVLGFPLVTGTVCLLLPASLDRARTIIAVVGSAICLMLAWQVFASLLPIFSTRYSLVLEDVWLNLRLDGLSALVMLGITFFGFLTALYSLGYMRGKARLREYYAYLLWTIGISCGAALANNLVLLLIFWGLLGFTLYMMIGIAGPDASAAAKKSFIVIGGSDCILMLGVGIVWLLTGTARMDCGPIALEGEMSIVAFLCFAIAAFAKAGAMPFHSWVPDCGEKAPASVAAFLPASLDKLLGIYLLVRATTDIFRMNFAMNTLLMFAGAATVFCAVMMALVQHDLKRLLSYHAVSQVGYMVLGIGTGTLVGLAGGLFHMLNNTIFKSSLFLCAGAVEQKAGGTDMDRLGGLARAMPLTFATCLVGALAISGVPPLNGFFSKWMVYQGIIESSAGGGYLWVVWLAAAMLGSALTVASFVKVLHATFLCKPSVELAKKKITEVNVSMWLPMVVLAAICILFGVFAYSLPLKNMIYPAVGRIWLDEFIGVWACGPATVMLVAGFLLGLVIYFLTTARKVRECQTYIGGEIMDEAYICGRERTENVEVTGVDFYGTVENLEPLKSIYGAARAKFFDIYDVGGHLTFFVSKVFQLFHTGVLRSYVTWCVVGLVILLFVLK